MWNLLIPWVTWSKRYKRKQTLLTDSISSKFMQITSRAPALKRWYLKRIWLQHWTPVRCRSGKLLLSYLSDMCNVPEPTLKGKDFSLSNKTHFLTKTSMYNIHNFHLHIWYTNFLGTNWMGWWYNINIIWTFIKCNWPWCWIVLWQICIRVLNNNTQYSGSHNCFIQFVKPFVQLDLLANGPWTKQ